jgi:hypothetical protein
MNIRIGMKGTTSLLVAAAIITAVLLFFPAYRVFFAISVLIGIAVAGILYLRNRFFPVKDEQIESKRPLGL